MKYKKKNIIMSKEWTKEEESLLAKLAKENYCTPCIAKKLDRTIDSIRNKADKLNISLKPNDNDKSCVKC